MNIDEIITNPARDEYIDQYLYNFKDAEVVAKIKNLVLKKTNSIEEIQYGLFTDDNQLVGYFSLYYYGKGKWVVSLVQLAQAYKAMGYGTFFYDYAVMNDNLQIMSDATNTDGVNGSKNLWLSLHRKKRYKVVGFDTTTNQVINDATPDMIYNQKTNIRWLAIPPGESINEAINRIKKEMSPKLNLAWYGPGTTTETYYNF